MPTATRLWSSQREEPRVDGDLDEHNYPIAATGHPRRCLPFGGVPLLGTYLNLKLALSVAPPASANSSTSWRQLPTQAFSVFQM